MEEVVVTAQRHETNLQQTPLSSRLSAEELELGGIDQGQDLGVMFRLLDASMQRARHRPTDIFIARMTLKRDRRI